MKYNGDCQDRQAVDSDMPNNTYRLYQMKDTSEMKSFIHQSFGTLMSLGYHPTLKDYDLTASGMVGSDDNVRTLCQRIQAKQQKSQAHRSMGIGDILVIRNGEVTCYFNDTAGFAVLDNFYKDTEGSTSLHLTFHSKNVSLPNRFGHWNVINSVVVENTPFFLLQNIEYGSNAT